MVTTILADLGADIIKVERPDGGDDTRSWGPPWHEGDSTYHLGLNRGKRSVTLDLKDQHDRDLAQTLIERADVLVENFRAGLMDDLELGYEQCRVANPALIYCSISGFAPDGPTAHLAGYDLLIQAMSGLMSVTGESGGRPIKVGAAITDMTAGLYATIGVLAALQDRNRTGKGQLVQVSLFDSALNALLNQGSAFVNASEVGSARGNRHPSIAPYESFRAADREFILAAANDRMWQRACRAIGRDDLAGDDRFATNTLRLENIEPLTTELAATFASRPAAYWIDVLRRAGVPAGPINRIDEAFTWASSQGLGPVVDFAGTTVRGVSSPIRLGGAKIGSGLPPPLLDEHGESIRAWLAARDEEVAD
mgnify:CR=1 FL=1